MALNCGSSSLKYQIFDVDSKKQIVSGLVEKIGLEDSYLTQKYPDGAKQRKDVAMKNHDDALTEVINMLRDASIDLAQIGGVGHRVVLGGEKFASSVEITDEVINTVRELSAIAPLHNPANLTGIISAQQLLPNAKQVAVFDTAFYSTLPEYVYRYAVPSAWYREMGVRKYGFHGTSHLYVSKRAAKLLNNPKPNLRGKDEWVRVPYEKAIKLIANELKKTRDERGAQGIFAGSYGWKSSGNMHNSRILLHRFMNCIGGFTGTVGDYSTGAAQVIMPHVLGTIEVYEQQTSWPIVLEHSKVVVIWGANPMRTLKISWTSSDEHGFKYLEELKKSGKKIICIDPAKTETCTYLNAQWISLVPGTDVAMLMGMAYHLLQSNKYDKACNV